MNLSWEDVRVFLAIAEAGSLSGAARQLGLGQPTVSRRLAQLEDDLGLPLFRRSVEGASLTAAGERWVEPARRMAEWAAEVERVAEGEDVGPRGVVRVTAPPGLAFHFMAPFAASLRETLPDIDLQVISQIRYVDLARREADLALRIEPTGPRDLETLVSLELENVACAAPEYAAKLAPGYGVADVDWIGWAPPFDHLPPNPQLAALVPGFRPAFASDDFLVQWRAAEAGLGAMMLNPMPHRLAPPRTLVPLELDFGLHARSRLHLVAARSALRVPRVEAVASRLVEELEATGLGQR
ncbi:MAG: LysR family transcriptional regulator [Deltaproteobacteria bacterium]|nr:LysR family transcriptional regulator [Deltaproteobacteria bacterium]MBW2447403.1 LysR family transcriptional regulator [Deltaproteobacteria bacterium]